MNLNDFFKDYCRLFQNKIVILDVDLADYLNVDVVQIAHAFVQLHPELRRLIEVKLTDREMKWLLQDRSELKGYRPMIIEEIGINYLLANFHTKAANQLSIALCRYMVEKLNSNGISFFDLLQQIKDKRL